METYEFLSHFGVSDLTLMAQPTVVKPEQIAKSLEGSSALPWIGNKKILAVEGLRGIAALSVVFFHYLSSFFPALVAYQFAGAKIPARYDWERIACQFPFSFLFNGSLAVSIFFVLSGYVLTYRYFLNHDVSLLQRAALKRYPRLALPTLAAVIFAWLLMKFNLMSNQIAADIGAGGWAETQYKDTFDFSRVLFDGLISIPIWGRGVDLNPPLWTMQVEVVGALLLFATYALFGKRGTLYSVLFFIIFAKYASNASPLILSYACLLVGSLIAKYQHVLRRNRALAVSLLIIGLFGCSFDFSDTFAWMLRISLPNLSPVFADLNSVPKTFWNSIGASAFVASLMGLPLLDRIFSNRVFVYLGRISYSVYLLHFPLIYSFSFWFVGQLKSIGVEYGTACGICLIATLAILFVLAELFYRLVDVPSIKLSDRLSKPSKYHRH